MKNFPGDKVLNICMKDRMRTKKIVDVIIKIFKYFTRNTCCIATNLFGLSFSWFVSVVKCSWLLSSARILRKYWENTWKSLWKQFEKYLGSLTVEFCMDSQILCSLWTLQQSSSPGHQVGTK